MMLLCQDRPVRILLPCLLLVLANLVVTSLFSCVLTSPEHTTQPAKIKAIFRKEKSLKSLRTEVGKGGRKKQLCKVLRLKGAGEVGGTLDCISWRGNGVFQWKEGSISQHTPALPLPKSPLGKWA